jgi:hypothetical protein
LGGTWRRLHEEHGTYDDDADTPRLLSMNVDDFDTTIRRGLPRLAQGCGEGEGVGVIEGDGPSEGSTTGRGVPTGIGVGWGRGVGKGVA